MKKVRYCLAVIALAAALSGPAFFQGVASTVSAAAMRAASSASASFVVGTSARPEAFIPKGACPTGGENDC